MTRTIMLVTVVAVMSVILLATAGPAFAISDQGRGAFCEHGAEHARGLGPPDTFCITAAG
jgi:hypothetical protein